MSPFFEPVPPREPPPPRAWGPPAWDRPSEGTLPAIVPIEEIVGQTDEAVMEVESLAVYPTGFVINLAMLANPHIDPHGRGGHGSMLMFGRGPDSGIDPTERWPRLGVRFADGRSAGSEAGVIMNVDKDENGFPTHPVLRMTGGGGGSRGFRYGVWVHPLPPDGPMEIFVAASATGSEEHRVVVDGAAVRAAAERAKVIWT
jgi:hypothetical protein